MWHNEHREAMLIRFLNPLETPLPSEVHELARSLLDLYRERAKESEGDISFIKFMGEVFEKYYPHVMDIVLQRNVSITEHGNILKWWKEILAVPSIQGLLISTQYPQAAPVVKLCVVTGYFLKTKWEKRSLRKLILGLESTIKEDSSLKDFSKRVNAYELEMLEAHVLSAEDEVDELANALNDARKRIYWKVKVPFRFT